MTLDELIASLLAKRGVTKEAGNAVVYVCLDDSEVEYLPVDAVRLEQDADGAILQLSVKEHPFGRRRLT